MKPKKSLLNLAYCCFVTYLLESVCYSQGAKPSPTQWINSAKKERLPDQKLNLISWLVDNCFIKEMNNMPVPKCVLPMDEDKEPVEFQTFDGFYNNIFKADLGAVDTPILRRVPPVYHDGVYEPVKKDRINPFKASSLMDREKHCEEGNEKLSCGSKTGKSAFLVYFGQQVVEELLDAQRPGCPPEYFNLEIPEDHDYAVDNPKKSAMPLLRSRYIQSSGHSPGNPRQQLNEITPWIDGGLVYGTSKGWADVLRTTSDGHFVEHGKLATDETGLFPARNKLRMPLANPPPPAFHSQWIEKGHTANVDRFFVLGNPRGNENAFLLSFGIVLFRWHNHFATYFHQTRPHWSGERIFQESRKWVIATYQKIVMYDWLTEWLGESVSDYTGYDPAVDPQIEQFFQTAAMRFGHTLVTPGAYMRDYTCAGCTQVLFSGLGGHHNTSGGFDSTQSVRTCNIFWRPQEPLEMVYRNLNESCGEADERTVADIDRLLMGMASQRAEREDHMIVEDLRGKVFGPLEFSRRDLMAINIQRGRDHGIPDYNTAREAFGLPRVNSVEEYMKETQTHTPEELINDLESFHMINGSNSNPWDNIDVWTGGILETSRRPGPLFRAIIKDQFTRIRNADRFWFENTKWKKPRFSNEQMERIKQITVYDMIMSVTRMLPEDLQLNPFQVPTDKNVFLENSGKCLDATTSHWQSGTCYEYKDEVPSQIHCRFFPQLDTSFVEVEQCTAPASYDYFTGSEASFIATYTVLGIFIIGVMVGLFFLAKYAEKKKKNVVEQSMNKNYKSMSNNEMLIAAKEWQNFKDGTRSVAVILRNTKITVRDPRGDLLREIDLKKIADLKTDGVNCIKVVTFKNGFVVIEDGKEYDLVLYFESQFIQEGFITSLKERLNDVIAVNVEEGIWKKYSKNIRTKKIRIKQLEKFFRHVFELDSKSNDDSVDQRETNNESMMKKNSRIFRFGGDANTQNSTKRHTEEIVNIELSHVEFADALGMCPTSDFVQKIFLTIDTDQNGYISFQEFFCLLAIFKQGTAEDKIAFLFKMYDLTGSGKVTIGEFKNMMRSMISAAATDVDDETINDSVNAMIGSSGLERHGFVTLKEFQELLRQHNHTMANVQLNFAGLSFAESIPSQSSNRLSRHQSFVHAVRDLNNGYNRAAGSSIGATERATDNTDITMTENRTKQSKWQRWFDVNRLRIFWFTLYTLVVFAIFAERAYYYSVEREHGGLRHIAGYGVTLTRGAASVMMFCYASLLITMCRNLITKLRDTFLQQWIPFDDFLSMHKYIACLALGFSILHVIGHGVNFYSICTQTADDLSCLFRDYHRPSHVLPKFHYWTYQTITGLTGILLVIHAVIIHVFATTFARKHTFRTFWITHLSYPLWYVLIILHGSGRLVQDPLFLNFLLGPLFLFILDKIITVGRENIEIPVIEAQLLPSNVTKLTIYRPTGFEFKSGQWIRLACLSLNPNEFHPFTISSAPHEPHLTVHIRAVGPFTANIRQIYESSTPKVYLDGPYGENHQDWYRFEVAVLIGGGIGVTPFSSILKDVVANPNLRNCKKIYFLWVTKTQKQFEWMIDIVRQVESHAVIDVHVFITQLYDKFDLRTVLLYICERNFQRVSNRSLFTGLKSATHFGRPNFKQFFKTLQDAHPQVTRFGVFSCGPLPMSKSVAEACVEINSHADSDAVFQHYYEHF